MLKEHKTFIAFFAACYVDNCVTCDEPDVCVACSDGLFPVPNGTMCVGKTVVTSIAILPDVSFWFHSFMHQKLTFTACEVISTNGKLTAFFSYLWPICLHVYI